MDTIKLSQLHAPSTENVWSVKNQTIYFNIRFFGIDAVGHNVSVFSDYEINPKLEKKYFDKFTSNLLYRRWRDLVFDFKVLFTWVSRLDCWWKVKYLKEDINVVNLCYNLLCEKTALSAFNIVGAHIEFRLFLMVLLSF
jgi:hypothetical protein